MTLKEKEREYQNILVQEYKRSHEEEVEHLTDEEISLMNPLTDGDFLSLMCIELDMINKEIVEIEKDKKYCSDLLDDKNVPSNEKPDLRGDIVSYNIKLNRLRKKYDDLRKLHAERHNNERGISR